ncbi:hypothetical protein F3J37_26170 [Pantoea sp. Al-1710]|uniref:Uncharacterized protein n=1 Tax=Candidatus Pantoea communis TaxID=2608354 RepID=A0ABX0RX30_9GAMM|nr:hypothetical protein [Pantoea communis]NIG22146.1 hypothetical protein [Pantoea communis]
MMSLLCRGLEAITDDIVPLLDKIIRVNGQTTAWLEPSSPFTIGEVPDFRLRLTLLDPVKTLFHLLTPTKLVFVQSQKKQTLGFICESMNDSRRKHGKIQVSEATSDQKCQSPRNSVRDRFLTFEIS